MIILSNIARINELSKLSRERELTTDEKAEQAKLRAEYVAGFKRNLESQLNNIEILEPDGSVTKVRELKKDEN